MARSKGPLQRQMTRLSIAVRASRIDTGVDPLTVAVIDEPFVFGRSALLDSLLDGVENGGRIRSSAYPPSDDAPGKGNVLSAPVNGNAGGFCVAMPDQVEPLVTKVAENICGDCGAGACSSVRAR